MYSPRLEQIKLLSSLFCTCTMQRQGTLQFWDDYHAGHTRQEWISRPSDEVLQLIVEQYIQRSNRNDNIGQHNYESTPLNVLEIGCGTSTLVRDVKEHFGKQYRNQQICRNVHARGTDVSPICVHNLSQRDSHLILQNNNHNNNNGVLEYKVLNVVDKSTSTRKWDLILDKGCLDTFLFRSRQRGPNSDYNDLIQRVLDNLHSWLKPRSGLYMFISPRTKIKAVRDYQGFASVDRYTLPASSISTLEGTKYDSGYLFVCTRNNDYNSGVSLPFRQQTNQQYPSDTATCSKCGVLFPQFRKGVSLQGRGASFLNRLWDGHCKHCKGANQFGFVVQDNDK
jgi:hypothetical protein